MRAGEEVGDGCNENYWQYKSEETNTEPEDSREQSKMWREELQFTFSREDVSDCVYQLMT